MPPNKNKGGGGRNKKGKGKAAIGREARASANTNTPGTFSEYDLQNLTSKRILPTFHHNNDKRRKTNTGGFVKGGYYEIYKESTARFWTWMKRTLPSNKMTSVRDLPKGVDAILKHNMICLEHPPPPLAIDIPRKVLDCLQTSINYREKFALIRFGGLDENHKYMVEALAHCFKVLKFARQVAKVASVDNIMEEKGDDTMNQVGGNFNALVVDDEDNVNEDETTEEDDEDLKQDRKNIRDRNFPTFKPPMPPDQEIDIETTLINGDDRFQAFALLQTMDDMMGAIENHYGLLKCFLRGQDIHDGNSIQLLMECAVAANMATECVQSAENALVTSYPHLSSFYHVLALVFLPNFIADIERKIDLSRLEQNPHMALHFVAEIIECCFHNKGMEGLPPGRIKTFVRKSGILYADVEMEAKQIHLLSFFESQLALEEKNNAALNQMVTTASGQQPHSWLEKYFAHIGGDRCILNTQKIVQMLMDIIKPNIKLLGKHGFWGSSFDEDENPAKRIRGDLDDAFAGRIMPELLVICWNAPFTCLPERRQLITCLDLLQEHVKGDRTQPVPVALTFSLHAIIVSIFVLQGDGDLARIASYSKQSYNTLFAQLNDISDESKIPQNAPNFYMNVGLFKNLVNFAKPVTTEYNEQFAAVDLTVSHRLAFWNPVIGGGYLLYGTYICSLGLGSATIDSLGQTRFTLHLYNALKQRDPTLSIMLLQSLDKAFGMTEAIWVGGCPKKGSYCKHFYMSWGMSLSEASRQAAGYSSNSAEDNASHFRNERQVGMGEVFRSLKEILPEEYSASYKRLVTQNYDDTNNVASYTIRNAQDVSQDDKGRFEDYSNLLIRINMTRDSMDDDEDILPYNLSSVGCILLEFTNALSEHMVSCKEYWHFISVRLCSSDSFLYFRAGMSQ